MPTASHSCRSPNSSTPPPPSTQGRARLPTNSRGQHTPFASLQSPTNQLASSIIWSNYGQRQIRSGEDDSADDQWHRRPKPTGPKRKEHGDVRKAKPHQKEGGHAEQPPPSA